MIYRSKGGAGADSDHTWIRPCSSCCDAVFTSVMLSSFSHFFTIERDAVTLVLDFLGESLDYYPPLYLVLLESDLLDYLQLHVQNNFQLSLDIYDLPLIVSHNH